jgi:hypothetical protein
MDNLHIYLQRGGLHAPNHTPQDGLVYRTIHNVDIQRDRRTQVIPCGPRGVIHDYVPFYFGYLSPMLLQLNTGRVEGYNDGQEPLIYLVSKAQRVRDSRTAFVFSDGHGIAAFTDWYDDLDDLANVDWDMVYQRYWADSVNDMDRQRRKQAEFLVHQFCDWSLVQKIAVINDQMRAMVEAILNGFPSRLHRPVEIHSSWYY